MTLLINILLGIYIFVSVLMMLIILMQRPKSEGLGAAFGGGVTENIFGAQTTNVLTKITGWLAAIFFLLTFTLSILYAHKTNRSSNLSRELLTGATPIPSASATPVPGVSVSPGPAASGTPVPGVSVSPGPAASGTVAASPAAGASTTPSAPVTNSPPAATSPGPSAAASVAPATSPNASVAPSASPKP